MKTRNINLLFVAIVLGLGWAMRGHFGHEWGAAWAGAMGAMAVLLVSKREDWASRAPVLVALGAIGWGVGGMMSYGVVIGYCRSLSFANSLYGYAMLAIIGGLYGFIGGGLFGLGLESGKENKPKWTNLIVEMFVGGFLVWGLLIYQMEWFMTPPRSELWAGCLGAALALAWFLYRNKFKKALRVASYAALGAGFGFAFGNFIQVLGSTSGIQYNWWNVMEFTLGFFGGLGMVYAVLTRDWPESVPASKTGNWIAIIFVFVFLPLTNYLNGMSVERFLKLAERLNILNAQQFAVNQMLFAGLSLILFFGLAILVWKHYQSNNKKILSSTLPALLFITSLHYTLFSNIQLGMFYRPFSFKYSDSLYIIIVAIMFLVWYYILRKGTDLPKENTINETWKRWGVIIISLLLVFVILALISINIHDALPGSHDRF
ncbi:MAG: hypothetical protein J7L04_03965 [Bacteroidales bacterium]|nr:hypothetical protein [Bacteroidales bacterium]